MRGIRRPAPHPPRWGHDVVRASCLLRAELKIVWRLISEYDAKAGCWASPERLARLAGIPATEWRSDVTELVRIGLLIRVVEGPREILFATLPAGMPADQRLTFEDKVHCAERLDRHINELVRLTSQSISDNELAPSESLTAVPEVEQSLEIISHHSTESGALTRPIFQNPNGNNENRKDDDSPETFEERRMRFRLARSSTSIEGLCAHVVADVWGRSDRTGPYTCFRVGGRGNEDGAGASNLRPASPQMTSGCVDRCSLQDMSMFAGMFAVNLNETGPDMTVEIKEKPVLWSWATLCAAKGYSLRQLRQLQARSDKPEPVRRDGDTELFDAARLSEWAESVRGSLKR